MSRIAIFILHPEPPPLSGPLVRLLADARRALAEHHAVAFAALGAGEARIVSGSTDDTRFGARLLHHAESARAAGANGIVVLGSGSLPLASVEMLERFTRVADGADGTVLVNNRYSADIVAIAGLEALVRQPRLTTLASDNALPRFLGEAGWLVDDARMSTNEPERLELDLDAPADLPILARHPACPTALRGFAAVKRLKTVRGRLDEIATIARSPKSELLVAGRTSSTTLRRLERETACRVRVLVEERGLKAGAIADASGEGQRPPASTLGMLLDDRGPEALGQIVARLADAALIDTRVLLAHRLGRDEAGWPPAEERFASDLLDWEAISDPWLAALTRAAAEAPVPIVLGAHALVGPGAPLALKLGPSAVTAHR